jgi:hypothetical protein
VEFRYLKDFSLALLVILLFAFAVKDYTIYKKVYAVPDKSKYADISVNEELMTKIRTIEGSIADRKMFTFNVSTDPLRQDPVIKDKLDRLQEWEYMIANTVRLAATFIDEDGERCAILAFQGKSSLYHIGDDVAGRKIVEIKSGQIAYTSGGIRSIMTVQPIPPKPADVDANSTNTDFNY